MLSENVTMVSPADQQRANSTGNQPLPTRNRIKGHRKVRAGDLVPHEWNFRLHPDVQRAALAGIYSEVGFARSLLAYELPDGRLKLIDGHLRRDFDPDMEVLDVNDEEARQLLLTIDPLAAIAKEQDQLHHRLLEMTPVQSPELSAVWQETLDSLLNAAHEETPAGMDTIPEQYMVLVTCRDEEQQIELLMRFKQEGLDCKALLS
jgi:hypothetical protein